MGVIFEKKILKEMLEGMKVLLKIQRPAHYSRPFNFDEDCFILNDPYFYDCNSQYHILVKYQFNSVVEGLNLILDEPYKRIVDFKIFVEQYECVLLQEELFDYVFYYGKYKLNIKKRPLDNIVNKKEFDDKRKFIRNSFYHFASLKIPDPELIANAQSLDAKKNKTSDDISGLGLSETRRILNNDAVRLKRTYHIIRPFLKDGYLGIYLKSDDQTGTIRLSLCDVHRDVDLHLKTLDIQFNPDIIIDAIFKYNHINHGKIPIIKWMKYNQMLYILNKCHPQLLKKNSYLCNYLSLLFAVDMDQNLINTMIPRFLLKNKYNTFAIDFFYDPKDDLIYIDQTATLENGANLQVIVSTPRCGVYFAFKSPFARNIHQENGL